MTVNILDSIVITDTTDFEIQVAKPKIIIPKTSVNAEPPGIIIPICLNNLFGTISLASSKETNY